MAECLGLYIEENLIKYAKISKSNDAIKLESFGIKFYENLENAIKQIIEETYSFKTPISINLSDEIYTKFDIFSMLSKQDLENVVRTQFESICYDKDENPSIYEQRFIPASASVQNDKIKIIHISATKAAIAQKKNSFLEYKIKQISPIGITISNLLKKEKKATNLIVNIEKNTIITKVVDNLVSDVEVLDIGAKNIINSINNKENSYSKAYEICKNSTIYTEQDKDLQYEENEYLVDIMPTLYEIANKLRTIIEHSIERINKVYITGTASVINNIDIYFEEYLKDVQCEILKPSFVSNNSKINIKDYIEVNSAISIALQGLEKNSPINFTKETGLSKASNLLKKEISFDIFKGKSAGSVVDNFGRPFNITMVTFALLTVFYFAGSIIITNQLDNKIQLAEKSINTTKERIKKIEEYTKEFNDQITEYENLIKEIENRNDIDSENKRFKGTIPNLLNNIMAVIPKQVQLLSVQNTSGSHIVITAKSETYDQLAYFKTVLKTGKVITNVVSDTGVMREGEITVTIEGELP